MPIRLTLPRAALAALCLAALHAGAATVTVTSAADNTTADGLCTLREAILAVNAAAASADCPATGAAWGTNDSIAFTVPGGGVQVLQPTSGYPALVRRVTVDGFTQPGASANTIAAGAYPNATGLNTQIQIELDGSALGGTAHGLLFDVGSSNSVVRGLAIVNFGSGAAGIRINTSVNGVLVGGNFIGWHADGTTRGANTHGVSIGTSFAVVVGNSAPSNRNLIAAGAGGSGVLASEAGNLIVEGNLIGVDRNGAQGGGVTPGAGITLQELTIASVGNNVVANHSNDGITLQGAKNTIVAGNTIGEGVGGVLLGNGGRGILITNGPTLAATGNQIHDNGIAASAIDGIQVLGNATLGDPTANRLDNNVIHASSGLGINLKPVGETGSQVTPNDALDPDGGPNGQQNFPVITSAQVNANGSISVAFTLNSTPSTTFDISAYANGACNASGQGEGRYRSGLNNTPVGTNASGQATGTITVAAPLPAGWGAGAFVALLANQSGDGTSEFSACAPVAAAAGVGTPPVMGDVPDQVGSVGTAFNLQLLPYVTPTDGDAVTTWDSTGVLPPGLQLSGGAITGTPTQAGSFTVQVRAGDKDGWSGYDAIVFTIAAAPGNPGGSGGSGGAPDPVSIPTLSEWGVLLAALLLGVAGLGVLRRRQG